MQLPSILSPQDDAHRPHGRRSGYQ